MYRHGAPFPLYEVHSKISGMSRMHSYYEIAVDLKTKTTEKKQRKNVAKELDVIQFQSQDWQIVKTQVHHMLLFCYIQATFAIHFTIANVSIQFGPVVIH